MAAQREIDRQDSLLNGLDADLQIVARVHVHKEFMSAATRKAMEVGERGRTLGDYVSRVKMRQVADSCMRTLGKQFAFFVVAVLLTLLNVDELRERLEQSREVMSRLNDGAHEVREFVNQQRYVGHVRFERIVDELYLQPVRRG